MHRSILLAIVALPTLLPVLASGQVLNGKLKAGQAALRNICVMPVETDWTKVGPIGREPKPREGDEWSAQIRPVIVEALVKAGAQDSSEGIAQTNLSNDENVRPIIFQLQQEFDAVAKLEKVHEEGIWRGRFSLGDAVALAPCAAHADAMLFVRAAVRVPPLARWATATLRLTFVDAKSGEILAQAEVGRLRMNNDFEERPREAYLDVLVERFREMRVGKSGGGAR